MERFQSEALFSMLETISKMNNRELTAEIFKFWLAALESFAFEDIKNAFSIFIQTESRMPLPADILKIIRGSSKDRALDALLKVEQAMEKHGGYNTVVFDDPFIHATIQSLGGWIKACRQTEYEFTWWKKDFLDRYEHYIRCGLPPHQEIPVKLSGIFDEANLPLGGGAQKPVVIGDYEKAIEWVSRMENSLLEDSPGRNLVSNYPKMMDGI